MKYTVKITRTVIINAEDDCPPHDILAEAAELLEGYDIPDTGDEATILLEDGSTAGIYKIKEMKYPGLSSYPAFTLEEI